MCCRGGWEEEEEQEEAAKAPGGRGAWAAQPSGMVTGPADAELVLTGVAADAGQATAGTQFLFQTRGRTKPESP